MRDLHCHILPGVDDGAADLRESMRMFEAAKRAGITSITCTPHCREPYFDYLPMWKAFRTFEAAVRKVDPAFPLQMGFEVNYRMLAQLGLGWAERLHYNGSNEFLLELSVGASPTRFGDYERTIFELQGLGYDVIIAHPERYVAIQRDISLAKELVSMGCKLQASADFIYGGRLAREKKPAIRMMREGLYTYIASDAHNTKHYAYFARAMEKYEGMLNG